MKTKDDSVILRGLVAEAWRALLTCETLHWELTGRECVVTRGSEAVPGQHPESLHLAGRAFDLRRWYIDRAIIGDRIEEALDELRDQLGPDYDVVPYPTHVHIEYDPKEETQA